MNQPLRKCSKCGLEAWIEEDLELFQSNKASKYGKRNICKKCTSGYMKNYERLSPKPKPAYLRKCKDCGLTAWTEEDLKLFRNDPNKPHGKDTWCLDCYNAWQRPRNYMRARREKQKQEVIDNAPKPLRCYFCRGLITVLEGKTAESIAVHSLDGNHENWDPKNKTPAHRGCHSRWHSTGDRNPKRRNKKGNDLGFKDYLQRLIGENLTLPLLKRHRHLPPFTLLQLPFFTGITSYAF